MMGVVAALAADDAGYERDDRHFLSSACFVDAVGLAEMRRAFADWSQSHRQRGHPSRLSGLADAPRETWPWPMC